MLKQQFFKMFSNTIPTMLPTTQTHISSSKLKAELNAKYAPRKPLLWKKNIPEARGVLVSVRK